MGSKIISVHGREILDLRGNPAVEADVRLESMLENRDRILRATSLL
jgi:enolase